MRFQSFYFLTLVSIFAQFLEFSKFTIGKM